SGETSYQAGLSPRTILSAAPLRMSISAKSARCDRVKTFWVTWDMPGGSAARSWPSFARYRVTTESGYFVIRVLSVGASFRIALACCVDSPSGKTLVRIFAPLSVHLGVSPPEGRTPTPEIFRLVLPRVSYSHNCGMPLLSE